MAGSGLSDQVMTGINGLVSDDLEALMGKPQVGSGPEVIRNAMQKII